MKTQRKTQVQLQKEKTAAVLARMQHVLIYNHNESTLDYIKRVETELDKLADLLRVKSKLVYDMERLAFLLKNDGSQHAIKDKAQQVSTGLNTLMEQT